MRKKTLSILKIKWFLLLTVFGALLFLISYFFFYSNRLPAVPEALATNSEDIHVVFNIDDNYAKFLSVTMISILQNTDEHLHFHILTNGLSETSLKKLKEVKKIKPFELDVITVDDERIAQIPDYINITIKSVANYRLLTSSLLPNLDKIIYLDTDLVLLDNIKKYWYIDVNDYYVAAVHDPADINKETKWIKNLPLPDKTHYFNSGMMIINLKKWREDNIEKRFFENSAKYAETLVVPDQDILNITLLPDVKYLDISYNFMVEFNNSDARNQALIIHWAGILKPWRLLGNTNVGHMKIEYFWHYAKYSPFYSEIVQICNPMAARYF